MINLTGKVALVTGSSRGIGQATALRLSKAGAAVYVNFSKDSEGAENTVKLLQNGGGTVCADVSDSDAVKAMFKKIRDESGGVDILVNNAGVLIDEFMMFIKDESWERTIDVNMKGTLYCMKAAARGMISKKWGRIINISSAAGLVGDSQRVHYSGAKAGIIGMTKAAAREMAAYNVTVNAIAPGLIDTELIIEGDEKKKEKLLGRIPLGRRGEPEDVAGAVLFLASEEASYITGQVLGVDGGLAIR